MSFQRCAKLSHDTLFVHIIAHFAQIRHYFFNIKVSKLSYSKIKQAYATDITDLPNSHIIFCHYIIIVSYFFLKCYAFTKNTINLYGRKGKSYIFTALFFTFALSIFSRTLFKSINTLLRTGHIFSETRAKQNSQRVYIFFFHAYYFRRHRIKLCRIYVIFEAPSSCRIYFKNDLAK